ncbi:MAG: nucleoside triphosphate pyrophosphohydrolase [Deltaproteobacteria bacterium]|nr:nucleoside triphosphate pyrophosphohydrolase [Deltaproteobacteria bacterium]
MSRAAEQLDRLMAIVQTLRSEAGCPWDRAQDIRSMRPFLIEEAYEVLEQMDSIAEGGPLAPLCEELGDLLFQIVFHAQIGHEQGAFAMADVVQSICDKIELRHPHVFAGRKIQEGDDVDGWWVKLKAEERRRKTGNSGSVLDGVPREAPALQRAERLTEKASRVRFDWTRVEDVRAKVDEELAELDEAIRGGDRVRIQEELGDTLFALANLGRWLHAPPEDALRGTIGRFVERFSFIEKRLQERGREPSESSLEEMDALWNEAKLALKSKT